MILVVCVDNHNGIAFNGRRQSQDKRVFDDMITLALERTTYIAASEYSRPLLEQQLTKAGYTALIAPEAQAGIFWSELGAMPEDTSQIDEIHLYCWNRDYPADMHFDMDISAFELTDMNEYDGNSHVLTRRIYKR